MDDESTPPPTDEEPEAAPSSEPAGSTASRVTSRVGEPDPAPGRGPVLLLTVLLLLSLGAGVASLVLGPHTPDQEARKDEVEILDGDPFSALGLTPEGVALVHVYGAISFPGEHYGQSQGADWTVRTLRRLRKIEAVKAVVLRVNSPGGTVAASEEIRTQVLKLKEAGKVVVVSMADMAASGGYFISAPADYIYTLAGTITGSIGVITQLPRYQEVAEKVGVDFVNITSGKYKDMGNPFAALEEDEVELFRTTVMNAYLQFLDVVAEGRAEAVWRAREASRDDSGWEARVARIEAGEADAPFSSDEDEDGDEESAASSPATTGTTAASTPEETMDPGVVRRRVRELADGRIYIGTEAVRLGLADAVGTLQDAIDKAGELSGLGKNPKILKPKTPSEFQKLFRMMGSRAPTGPLGGALDTFSRLFGGAPAPAAYAPVRPMPVAYLYGPGLGG